MGCCVGKEDDYNMDKKSIKRSEHKLGTEINGIQIEIVKADVLKQDVECMVLGSDIYLKNRNSFKANEKEHKIIQDMMEEYRGHNVEQLFFGDAVETQPQFDEKKCKVKSMVHVTLPLYKGGEKEEFEVLEKGIQNAFKIAQKYESVAFTDIASSIFGYPKQDLSRIFSKVLKTFVENMRGVENMVLKKILVVLRDDQTIHHFERKMGEKNLVDFQKEQRLQQKQIKQYESTSIVSRYSSMVEEMDFDDDNDEADNLKKKLLAGQQEPELIVKEKSYS